MNINANLYREGGQWVIEIEAEQWVLNDMAHDANRKKSVPVDVIIKADRTVYGGSTRYEDDELIPREKSLGILVGEVLLS